MDFVFAPSRNRKSYSDLTAYAATNKNSSPNGDKFHAIQCCFSAEVTAKMGWVRGDRLLVEWSKKDNALTFVRIGVDDPRVAYRISFTPNKSKRTLGSGRIRLGCPDWVMNEVFGGESRRTFSLFEVTGGKVVFVANN